MKFFRILSSPLFWMLVLCGAVFVVASSSMHYYVKQHVILESDKAAARDLAIIHNTIDNELLYAQMSIRAFCSTNLNNGLRIPDEETIYEEMEQFLSSHNNLSGIVVGFEDEIFPAYAGGDVYGFVPLIRHQGDDLVRYQIGTIRDVRNLNDWYRVALERDTCFWCRPFFSEEGEIISCYSIPLHDASGKVIGVLACDYNISRFLQVVETIKPYPSSQVRIMQSDLKFIFHPDSSFVLSEFLPSEFSSANAVLPSSFYDDLYSGKKGSCQIEYDGEKYFAYYDHVASANDLVLVTSPEREVYGLLAKLDPMTYIVTGLAMLIMLSSLAVVYRVNQRNEKRRYNLVLSTAKTDALTGIDNRYSGESSIRELLASHCPGVFCIFDCDKFKAVNDCYGHRVGDELLILVARTLKQTFPDQVTMRLGGDEFSFFLKGTYDATQLDELFEHFFKQIRSIHIDCMGDYSPSISLGAVRYDGQTEMTFDTLYSAADHCLYNSKKVTGCSVTIG